MIARASFNLFIYDISYNCQLKLPFVNQVGYRYIIVSAARPGPEIMKLFSYSTELRMKFIQLINVKMPTLLAF